MMMCIFFCVNGWLLLMDNVCIEKIYLFGGRFEKWILLFIDGVF